VKLSLHHPQAVLRKCKEILKKEKVWNIFKNFDQKACGYLTYDQAILAYIELLEKKV
jgi:hypothetical protein